MRLKKEQKAFLPALAILLLTWNAAAAKHLTDPNKALFTQWSKIAKPFPGPTEPIGAYAAGCLAGAKKLPLDGIGYSVMRPSRQRFYGHDSLLGFIENLGEKLHRNQMPILLVGDMGRPRGGPMISGHASHQIGLDVDLWYRMSAKRPRKKERESWASPSLVKNDSLTPAWSEKTRKLLVAAAEFPSVNRIFVNPAIKRDLCQKFPEAAWLYKVRAWWGHADHLHVRLNCPEGSSACVAQAPLDPKDSQCGKDLDWWFTAEAKEEWLKKSSAFSQRAFPELPASCAQMVSVGRVSKK